MDYRAFVSGQRTWLSAPAGYGKTYTIVECLKIALGRQLILTHTHAGVASIKAKLIAAQIDTKAYQVETISSFAQTYFNAFYTAGDAPSQEASDYHKFIIEKVAQLMRSNLVRHILVATYSGVFVDEYQDCSKKQHEMIVAIAEVLPTHILGDPLQGIFDFGDTPVDIPSDISNFLAFPELNTPHRWIRANRPDLGQCLSEIRKNLKAKQPININDYTSEIEFVCAQEKDKAVRETAYFSKLQELCKERSVLVIHPHSSNMIPRIRFAQSFPGFSLVESIDHKDFYTFAKASDQLLQSQVTELTMRNYLYELADVGVVGRSALDNWFNPQGFKAKRDESDKLTVDCLRKQIKSCSSSKEIQDILESIFALKGLRCYRPELLWGMRKALHYASSNGISIFDAMKQHRNVVRRNGRKVDGRCIGTTLLTKGLEFDTVAILDAQHFKCPKNFYVAMTRCCRRLIVFADRNVLLPYSK